LWPNFWVLIRNFRGLTKIRNALVSIRGLRAGIPTQDLPNTRICNHGADMFSANTPLNITSTFHSNVRFNDFITDDRDNSAFYYKFIQLVQLMPSASSELMGYAARQCCPTFLYIGAHLTDGCGGAGALWRLQLQ
jgi:hypothetical protein